ncbi:hypothetical protein [Pararhizobium sp. O133]|uniref:hypothetical protein n=1 Tax=Pararhizobium sp. O133 TaxID=3449278 RepID=UPI003F6869DD
MASRAAFGRCRANASLCEQARATPEIGAHILDDGIHGFPQTGAKQSFAVRAAECCTGRKDQ